jgi:hypothetical protein
MGGWRIASYGAVALSASNLSRGIDQFRAEVIAR